MLYPLYNELVRMLFRYRYECNNAKKKTFDRRFIMFIIVLCGVVSSRSNIIDIWHTAYTEFFARITHDNCYFKTRIRSVLDLEYFLSGKSAPPQLLCHWYYRVPTLYLKKKIKYLPDVKLLCVNNRINKKKTVS